jgi:hypothetical protein
VEGPKCPYCGKNHFERICPELRKTVAQQPKTVPIKTIEKIFELENPTDLRSGYNAYMREYMRNRRAALKK